MNMTKEIKARKELREWLIAITIALIAVLLVRHFLFTTYIVSGQSMEPNFHDGDRMIINKIIYSMRDPKPGEVVVLHASKYDDYIKRVIAVEGDTVRIEYDDVYVNGIRIDEPYIDHEVQAARESHTVYNRFNQEDIVIPEGHIYVLGDNRSNSMDSRSMGPIPINEVVGRSDFIFYPFDRIGGIQH